MFNVLAYLYNVQHCHIIQMMNILLTVKDDNSFKFECINLEMIMAVSLSLCKGVIFMIMIFFFGIFTTAMSMFIVLVSVTPLHCDLLDKDCTKNVIS